jgi:hypothetical protein
MNGKRETSMSSELRADTWNGFDIFNYESSAEFSWELGTEPVAQFQEAFLRASHTHGIWMVEAIGKIGYERQRDGFVLDFLRSDSDRVHAVDEIVMEGFYPPGFILAINDHDFPTAATRLSYINKQGRITEATVTDTMDIARNTDIAMASEYSPILISADSSEEVTGIGVSMTSAIWFPWNLPHKREIREYLDNRVLAHLNGRRFNLFLREIRDACLALGGRWVPQPPTGNVASVDDNGFIILDAPRPPRL